MCFWFAQSCPDCKRIIPLHHIIAPIICQNPHCIRPECDVTRHTHYTDNFLRDTCLLNCSFETCALFVRYVPCVSESDAEYSTDSEEEEVYSTELED